MWLSDEFIYTTSDRTRDENISWRYTNLRAPVSGVRSSGVYKYIDILWSGKMPRWKRYVLYATWFGLALFALVVFVTIAPAHDIYNQWAQPDRRTPGATFALGSCCHDRDCFVTHAKKVGNEWWALDIHSGAWVKIPKDKWNDSLDAPGDRWGPNDGQNHLCTSPNGVGSGNVYCFEPGSGS